MGCWNETCGITQMPIHSGDPIALLFLSGCDNWHDIEHPDNHAGHCYSTDVWSPIAMPIFGNYNDYGSIEDVEESYNVDWIVSQIKKQMLPITFKKYDTVIDIPNITIEEVCNLIHDSKIQVAGPRRSNPIGFMMIHRAVYDHMTTIHHHRWSESKSVNDVIESGLKLYSDLKNEMASASDLSSKFMIEHHPSCLDHTSLFSALFERGARLAGYGTLISVHSYKDLIFAYINEGLEVDDPKVVEFTTDMARYLTFHNNCEILRKTYMPQAGKGSQAGCEEQHIALHQVAISLMQARLDKWAHENGEDDEDEG